MLRVPHRLIEGCLIAAHAIQSKNVYIYIRGEYLAEYEVLEAALDAGARRGDPRRRRDRHPPRRRRVHLRRGDRPARVARGQARAAALEAAVPRDLRPLRVADADQQRRDDHDRPEGARDRPGGVRADRRAAGLDRHARLLPLRQREAARRVRAAARDHGAAPDRGRRRRRPRRTHAQGRDDGRLVVPGDDARRSRHAARRELAQQAGLLHRLRRRQRDRRPGVHRAVRAPRRAVLRARVVRQVHAVPCRNALARAAAARGRDGTRVGAGSRAAARRLRPDHRQVPLRARRLGGDAGGELRVEVPRRVPRAPRARRLPLRRRLVAGRAVRADRPARACGPGSGESPVETSPVSDTIPAIRLLAAGTDGPSLVGTRPGVRHGRGSVTIVAEVSRREVHA